MQKKNGYTHGKRRMNSRTSIAQRDDVIKRTVYVSDIDHQVKRSCVFFFFFFRIVFLYFVLIYKLGLFLMTLGHRRATSSTFHWLWAGIYL